MVGHRLKVSENKLLKRIFAPKEEVIDERRKMNIEKLHRYFSPLNSTTIKDVLNLGGWDGEDSTLGGNEICRRNERKVSKLIFEK